MRERIYKALLGRYQNQMEEAFYGKPPPVTLPPAQHEAAKRPPQGPRTPPPAVPRGQGCRVFLRGLRISRRASGAPNCPRAPASFRPNAPHSTAGCAEPMPYAMTASRRCCRSSVFGPSGSLRCFPVLHAIRW